MPIDPCPLMGFLFGLAIGLALVALGHAGRMADRVGPGRIVSSLPSATTPSLSLDTFRWDAVEAHDWDVVRYTDETWFISDGDGDILAADEMSARAAVDAAIEGLRRRRAVEEFEREEG